MVLSDMSRSLAAIDPKLYLAEYRVMPEQIGAYSKVNRDPRGRTVTVAYLVMIDVPVEVRGQDDAAQAKWFPISELPPLAFDHDDIMRDAMALFQTVVSQKNS